MKNSLRRYNLSILLLLVSTLSSCTFGASSNHPIESTLTGSAVGAGTGALIGAAIPNGDIALSAGLGGAIGLPVGLALGTMYLSTIEKDKENMRQERIEYQRRLIIDNKEKIEVERERLRLNAPGEPDPSRKINYYDGPTLGQYR